MLFFLTQSMDRQTNDEKSFETALQDFEALAYAHPIPLISPEELSSQSAPPIAYRIKEGYDIDVYRGVFLFFKRYVVFTPPVQEINNQKKNTR